MPLVHEDGEYDLGEITNRAWFYAKQNYSGTPELRARSLRARFNIILSWMWSDARREREVILQMLDERRRVREWIIKMGNEAAARRWCKAILQQAQYAERLAGTERQQVDWAKTVMLHMRWK